MNLRSKYCISLTDKECKEIEKESKCYEDKRSALVGALKILQKTRTWIEDRTIFSIAEFLDIPSSDVDGLATFYSQIFRKPVGRHIIRYCDSVVCYITGYRNIESEIIKLLKINPGQTTSDNRFTLLPVSCLGNCDKGPTIMIDDDIYSNVKFDNILKLLEEYL